MNIRNASRPGLGRLVAALLLIVGVAVGLHKLTDESVTGILTALAAVLVPLAGAYTVIARFHFARQKTLVHGNVASTLPPHSEPSNDGTLVDGE